MFYEVIISGAGLTGLILGLALTSKGHSVIIFDANHPDKLFDGRTSAISYRATQFLEKIGVWNDLKPYSSPIYQIHTSEKSYPFILNFSASCRFNSQPLGYMIKNSDLKQILYSNKNLNIIYNLTYKEIYNTPSKIRLIMEDNSILDGLLLVAAEGKNSRTRHLLKFPTWHHNYNQCVITCIVAHLEEHNNIAQERFYPEGPFSTLR